MVSMHEGRQGCGIMATPCLLKTVEQLSWVASVAIPSSTTTGAGTRDASNNYSSIRYAVCAKLTIG